MLDEVFSDRESVVKENDEDEQKVTEDIVENNKTTEAIV